MINRLKLLELAGFKSLKLAVNSFDMLTPS